MSAPRTILTVEQAKKQYGRRAKLTKRLVFELPEGTRLFSNCWGLLDTYLGTTEMRERLWPFARKRRATGRLAWIFYPGEIPLWERETTAAPETDEGDDSIPF